MQSVVKERAQSFVLAMNGCHSLGIKLNHKPDDGTLPSSDTALHVDSSRDLYEVSMCVCLARSAKNLQFLTQPLLDTYQPVVSSVRLSKPAHGKYTLTLQCQYDLKTGMKCDLSMMYNTTQDSMQCVTSANIRVYLQYKQKDTPSHTHSHACTYTHTNQLSGDSPQCILCQLENVISYSRLQLSENVNTNAILVLQVLNNL